MGNPAPLSRRAVVWGVLSLAADRAVAFWVSDPMPPGGSQVVGEVRIKYYGVMCITKRRYVSTQAVVLGLTVVFLFLALAWQPSGAFANFFFVNLEWFFLLVLVLEIAETAVMMRKFRDVEARRQAGGAKPF